VTPVVTDNDGVINVTVSGGGAPYSYLWFDYNFGEVFATTENVSNAVSGINTLRHR
jgi:hypothetical protein